MSKILSLDVHPDDEISRRLAMLLSGECEGLGATEAARRFQFNQALGWKRTGTLNLHVRYAQVTMALIAQAAIHQLRQRLGLPTTNWDAEHLARNLFHGLEGDIRVRNDTIVVTYYNAPTTKASPKNFSSKVSAKKSPGSITSNSTSGSNNRVRCSVLSIHLSLRNLCCKGWVPPNHSTQGSPQRATLGWVVQSLRDRS